MHRSNALYAAIAIWLTGLAAASAALAGWLTTPAVADLFWPADINATVVRLLGGDAATDAIGRSRLVLSVFSVAIRLTGLTLLAGFAAWITRRADKFRIRAGQLLTDLGIAWIGLGVLWGVVEFIRQPFVYQTLPSAAMCVTGFTIWRCLTIGRRADTPNSGTAWGAWTIVLSATVAWITVSFLLNERLYTYLLIPHGDSAMYEEHLWNVWHGKGFRSYLDQGLFLGEHIQVIHLLLIPLHMVWPSHLLLELAESIALGSCTIPLFLIARRQTGDSRAAALLAIAWLFYAPMHFLDIAIDQKTFRPLCLGLPFLFWMIQSAERGRFFRASVCLLIAISAKEDVTLVTGPMAAVFALSPGSTDNARAARRWGIAAAAFSLAWLLASVLVIIPAFRSGEVVHYSRYFGDLGNSPGELLTTAVTEPGRVLVRIFSGRTLQYVVVLAAPFCFLIFRSPLRVAAGLLTFVMLSLIQLGTDGTEGGMPPVPYHHFHAPLLVVLFWAAAVSLKTLTASSGGKPDRPLMPASARSGALLILCCCVTTGFTGSLFPTGTSFWSDASAYGRHALYFPRTDRPNERRLIERAAMAQRVVALIPESARVASTDFIHTRLTHRERSYDYSDYSRVVNERGKRVPADTEYIVIDTGHRYSTIRSPENIPELRKPENWVLLPDETDGLFLILRRE